MCGIAGWFSPGIVKQECESELQSMINAISYRGPDGQGSLVTEHAALGHARLSIIDLNTGRQPMSLGDKYHIIFNGEIYNYQELRAGLIEKGHKFHTKSDTEVILALYAEHGSEAFSRLRGMFALAIWDRINQRGILARDTIGIKPLFYEHLTDGELVFGSEAKAILARKGKIQRALDENALHLLMNFRYLPGDKSLFRGIRQLEPGTIMQWMVNEPIKKLTYEFRPESQGTSVFDELERSCQIHLTSDVEVGTYLSGGIDSASITAFAARHTAQKLKTFTLNIGDDPDEAKNAARSAELLQVGNIQGDVRPELDRQLLDLVWHLEVPKVNALQISYLAKLASENIKVVLSGLGGDELFLGYNAHKIIHQANLVDSVVPRMLSRIISTIVHGGIGHVGLPFWSEPERASLMLGSLGDWPRVYGLLRNVWDSPKLRQQIYGPRLLDIELDDAFEHIRQGWTGNADPVTAVADFEWRNKMVNDLLWQEDRCSMAVGLEVRVPFLDPALKNAVQKMSRRQLMPGGRLKGYMQAMLKELLPKEILSRPKSGFQVDAATFFNTRLKSLADYWLSPVRVREMQIFNPDFVKTVRLYPSGKAVRWHYFMLYLMIMTHQWVYMFEQGNQP
ncbi:MAG: asparagine synthase (glutamine-hydrolyzing) [Gammaproteobacteria bacterium]|jgi:asparagine synthase (glutamine-hydrolysing)